MNVAAAVGAHAAAGAGSATGRDVETREAEAMWRRIGIVAAALAVAGVGAGIGTARVARAAASCSFTTKGTTMTLTADCTTDRSIIIPNGFTLDGAGHTITAVDPTGGHFDGGVVQNGGATASVRDLIVTTSGLAEVCDAGADRLRGILFDGASGSITNNVVRGINQNQGGRISGCQEGNGIEVRNFGSNPATVSATITGNAISDYQKTGIVANGNVSARISDNTVTGSGPNPWIAQNGVQVGYGADAQVMRNTVSANSYTGSSASSGGILVVGGPGYDGPYTTGTQIVGNTLIGNDVGVYLSNVTADFGAPATATNIKVINNTIRNDAVTNGYVYQAGVSDQGNNDKIINNTITGAGYNPATRPGSTFAVDADPSVTNRAKVHANK